MLIWTHDNMENITCARQCCLGRKTSLKNIFNKKVASTCFLPMESYYNTCQFVDDWTWFSGNKLCGQSIKIVCWVKKTTAIEKEAMIALFSAFSESARLTSHKCCWRYLSCKCNSSTFIFQNEMIIRMHEIMWFDKRNCRPLWQNI